MKQFVATILLVLYFTFSTGMVISKHFCMNEPVAVSIHGTDNHTACGKCGMESKKGCCHDEVSVYKITDSHASVTADFDFKATQFINLNQWLLSAFEITFPTQLQATGYKPPPPLLSHSDRQALICVFRI